MADPYAHYQRVRDGVTREQVTKDTKLATLCDMAFHPNLNKFIGVTSSVACQISTDDGRAFPQTTNSSIYGYDLTLSFNKLVGFLRDMLAQLSKCRTDLCSMCPHRVPPSR